jgi:Luciferase-like monooxygenase
VILSLVRSGSSPDSVSGRLKIRAEVLVATSRAAIVRGRSLGPNAVGVRHPAACALGTSRTRIMTTVTRPVTRHPSVTTAAMLALIQLAPRRVAIGIGPGSRRVRRRGEEAMARDEYLCETCKPANVFRHSANILLRKRAA